MHNNLKTILAKVTKPARYLGTEWNAIHKDHHDVKVTFALVFPEIYEIGMSYLGFKILYHLLNNREDVAAERVFAPWIDMEEKMRQNGLSLFALESGRPVREFDLVGFTLQYEMTYSNIINMLDLAGIPLFAADRKDGDPIILAGGPAAYNPEPLADFFDFFVLGEGEEVIHEIIDQFVIWKEGKGSRKELLARLAKIEGIYVPSFYQVKYHAEGTIAEIVPAHPDAPPKVQKRVIQDLDAVDFPVRPIVPFMDIVHNRAMLEVFRGCTRGCRFCQAGMIYRPVRERTSEVLMRHACDLLAFTGYDEISLTSLSTNDYSRVKELVENLIATYGKEGVGVSLPSLRTDAFSVQLAEQVQKVRKTGLTFAPEAGTQRLRDVINKGVTEEDVEKAVTAALEAGWQSFKFYFMIGLPTETFDDLDGIAELAHKVLGMRASGEKSRTPSRITVSVSTFVPKPMTPFQWEPQDSLSLIKQKQHYLKDRLKHKKIVYNYHTAELSFLEGVFSRGDRRLGKVLVSAWQKGCRFDGWSEMFRYDLWMESFAENQIDPHFYVNRRREYAEILPWDHLSAGIDKKFLISEHEKALREEPTADCRSGRCGRCGVCTELRVRTRLSEVKE